MNDGIKILAAILGYCVFIAFLLGVTVIPWAIGLAEMFRMIIGG